MQRKLFQNVGRWENFLKTFRFSYHLRDSSEMIRARLLGYAADESESLVKATKHVQEIFGGDDVRRFFEEFNAAERDKRQWLETSR